MPSNNSLPTQVTAEKPLPPRASTSSKLLFISLMLLFGGIIISVDCIAQLLPLAAPSPIKASTNTDIEAQSSPSVHPSSSPSASPSASLNSNRL